MAPNQSLRLQRLFTHSNDCWLFTPTPLTAVYSCIGMSPSQVSYLPHAKAAATYFTLVVLFSSSLIRTQEGISDRWNLTFIWSHSSVTSVGAPSKNRPKTNRTEQNPAKIKHSLRFAAAAPHPSLSFHFSPPFVPLLCIFFQSCHSPLLVSEALFEQNRKETET